MPKAVVIIDDLGTALYSDPEHQCVGRSAKERLVRMVNIADQAGLELSTIREISHRSS
jgi:hypothetical protein